MGELEGKVVAVTGAGAGIGRALAVAFARAGASVVCNDIDATSAEATRVAVANAGGSAVASVGDASTVECAEGIVAVAESSFGGLDVMVANAAISIYAQLDEMTLDAFHAVIDTNLKGPLLSARAAVPAMRRRGGGSLIFVSSVQAFQGLPGAVAYSAAKAGLVAAARTLSVEVGRDGIRVNVIAPGTIDTPMLNVDVPQMSAEERENFITRVEAANALGRIGRPDEIADVAVFLASGRASYMTGSCVLVDGGFLAVKPA